MVTFIPKTLSKMMNKKTLLTLLVLLTFVGGIMAQGRGRGKGRMKNKTPEQRAEIKTQRMVKPLKITDEQRPKIKELHLTAENGFQSIRADKKAGSITKEEAKAKRKEIRKTRKEGVKSVLTDEQKAKYRKWKKRRKGRKGKGRKGKKKKKDTDSTDDDDNDDDDNGGK